MNDLIIICMKDNMIGEELVRRVVDSVANATYFKLYTTNVNAGSSFEVVSNKDFFDMVEECRFIEFHSKDNEYYGTPHVSRKAMEQQSFMLNSVEVALDIKDYHKKVVTVYVMPEKDVLEGVFEKKASLLDFLVAYSSIEEAVEKIQRIAKFMQENAMP